MLWFEILQKKIKIKKKCTKTAVEIVEPPTIKVDILGNLPIELSYMILVHYLTPDDIANAFECCETWRQHMNYEYLWKSLHRTFFDCKEPNTEVYRKKIQSYSLRWQGHFMYDRMLEFNMKNNIFKDIKIQFNYLGSHKCQYFDNRKLIVASDFLRSVVIINTCTGLVEREIKSIESLYAIVHGDLLIAITDGAFLTIWNIEDGNCVTKVFILKYTYLPDFALLACQHLVIIGYGYEDLIFDRYRIFDMKTQKFNILADPVCIDCTENRIAIAKYTGSIEILDCDLNLLTKFDCLEACKIRSVIINDDFVVKHFQDLQTEYLFSVWNIKTKANFKINLDYKFYQKTIGPVRLTPKNKLVFQSDGFHCDVWDLSKQTRQFSIEFKTEIYNMYSSCNCIILDLKGGPQVIYCLRTGTFVKNFSLGYKDFTPHIVSKEKILYLNFDKNYRHCYWKIADYEVNMLDTEKLTNKSSSFPFFNTKRLRLGRNK